MLARKLLVGVVADFARRFDVDVRDGADARREAGWQGECRRDLEDLAEELTISLNRDAEARATLVAIRDGGYVDACPREAGCAGCDDCFVVCAHCAATISTKHASFCPVGVAERIVGHGVVPAVGFEPDVADVLSHTGERMVCCSCEDEPANRDEAMSFVHYYSAIDAYRCARCAAALEAERGAA